MISHEVELTTRDIGLRVALGATRSTVVVTIYRRVGSMLLAGVAAGLAITEAVHKVMSAVVVIHPEKDAAVIVGLAAALLAVGAISVVATVLRAAKIDPIVALHYE